MAVAARRPRPAPLARRRQLGESSPVLSNPNQQAITRGEDLAAKHVRLDRQDARREPVARQAGLRRRHVHQPGRQGARSPGRSTRARPAPRTSARSTRSIPIVDFGSTSNVTSSVFDERGYGCGQGRRRRRYIAKRGAQGQGARDRRAARAVDHELHELLHRRPRRRTACTVVGKQNNVKDTAATAQPIVQDLLTKNPDVNAIWCYNDPSCLGAGAVVRAAGQEGLGRGQAEGHRHHGRQRLGGCRRGRQGAA